MERLYTVLFDEGVSPEGGGRKWDLPIEGTPGAWMAAASGPLDKTGNGYRLLRPDDLPAGVGPRIFAAEGRGGRLECDSALIVREARLLRETVGWNDRTARLFACDCAEHALMVFRHSRPYDDRPHAVIEAARRFATDRASEDELRDAWATGREVMTMELGDSGDAWSAARAAMMTAAVGDEWHIRSIAGQVAHSAQEAVAWAATRATAREHWGATDLAERTLLSASMSVAWQGAMLDERHWQADRLLGYLGERREGASAPADVGMVRALIA
jgi:hypothetical protein